MYKGREPVMTRRSGGWAILLAFAVFQCFHVSRRAWVGSLRATRRLAPTLRATQADGMVDISEDEDLLERTQIEDFKVGQQLNGIVNRVASFGCFVDVGAEKDGLVHISRVSSKFVAKIENFVHPGQVVKVWVHGVSDGKLDLTMVEPAPNCEDDLSGFVNVSPEEWLEGTVKVLADYGAFVSVTPPNGGTAVNGLVHISRIKEGFVDHPAQELQVGQSVKVRVIESSPKLKLSMRPWRPGAEKGSYIDPEDLAVFKTVDPRKWLVGRVHHTVPFGIFVDVPVPGKQDSTVQGMVHVSEIKDGFVDDAALEVQVDQEVKVRVVSAADGRLSLSMLPHRPS